MRFVDLSFEQLSEWVAMELYPLARPAEARQAWSDLRFEGDVDKYLGRVAELTLAYPIAAREA